LQISAMRQLVDLGVEVRTGIHATNLSEQGCKLATNLSLSRKIWRLQQRLVCWPFARRPIDSVGRVIVNKDLSIPDHPEVQVIGDLANFSHQTGQPLPGVSPVAMQQGRHAARNILAMIDRGAPQRFWYFDKGSMATIGRNKAVADLKLIHLSGIPAWLAWLFVHVIFLVGFRNRLAVLFQWAWAYFSFNRAHV